MDIDTIREAFGPAISEIIDTCRIVDDFVDKDKFRVYMVTVWGNAVLEPERTGIQDSDLETLHDYLSEEIQRVVGPDEDLSSCYRYLMSQEGVDSMTRQQLSARHKTFIRYFAQLVLQQEFDEIPG